jgi:hypothetical protein
MTSANQYKDKIHLQQPLRYKIDGGWLWTKTTAKEVWTKVQYNYTNETKISIVNQWFGENPDWYSTIGLAGHDGIDLLAKVQTCLYAPCDGVVWRVQDDDNVDVNDKRFGYIQINGEENGIKFRWLGGHLTDSFVKVGDKVHANDLIGLTGNTGTFTTGAHLHASFTLLDKSGNALNLDNGFHGQLDHKDLYETLYAYKSDELQRLWDYAKANNIWYVSLGGRANFETDKKKLGISGVTFSQYLEFSMKKLFF